MSQELIQVLHEEGNHQLRSGGEHLDYILRDRPSDFGGVVSHRNLDSLTNSQLMILIRRWVQDDYEGDTLTPAERLLAVNPLKVVREKILLTGRTTTVQGRLYDSVKRTRREES